VRQHWISGPPGQACRLVVKGEKGMKEGSGTYCGCSRIKATLRTAIRVLVAAVSDDSVDNT
jgi:hypothetical protein